MNAIVRSRAGRFGSVLLDVAKAVVDRLVCEGPMRSSDDLALIAGTCL
jgi:hypothetical protein